MTDTPEDLQEAVKRFSDLVECALDPQGASAVIRALSAAYEREKARAEAAEAERDALDAVLSARVGCTDLAIIKAKSDLEAAEAKLKEAETKLAAAWLRAESAEHELKVAEARAALRDMDMGK